MQFLKKAISQHLARPSGSPLGRLVFWTMQFLKKAISQHLARPSGSPLGRLVFWTMMRQNEYLERCAIDRLCLQPDDVLLEVGFGHGLGLEYAATKIVDGRIYGVDVSEFSYEAALERLYEHVATRKVRLYNSSVESLPLNSDSVSKAFHCNCFYFWPDVAAGCSELHRVLRPGGLMLTVQNIQRVLRRKEAGQLGAANTDFVGYMQTLERVGFTDVKVEYHSDDRTDQPYQVIQARKSKV